MIRLTEAVLNEIQNRSCPPLESFIFAIRLQMWPVFQKLMTENIDSLKKYAEGTSLSYFARAASTTDASVISVELVSLVRCRVILISWLDMQALHRDFQPLRGSD